MTKELSKAQKERAADEFFQAVAQQQNSPQLMDLRQDVALLREVRDRAMKRMDLENLSADDARELREFSAETGRLISRHAECEAKAALTSATVFLLQAEIIGFIQSLPLEYQAGAIQRLKQCVVLGYQPSAPALPEMATVEVEN